MGFIYIGIPPIVVGPGGVPNEMDERKEVLQLVLNGCPCQAPINLTAQAKNCTSCLDHTTLDIVSLV